MQAQLRALWARLAGLNGRTWIQILGLLIVISLAIAFMVVPAVRNDVAAMGFNPSNEEIRAALIGAFVMLGLLIVVDDRISNPIIRQQNLGYVMILVGVYLAVGQSIIPILQSITPWQVISLIVGLVILYVGRRIIH